MKKSVQWTLFRNSPEARKREGLSASFKAKRGIPIISTMEIAQVWIKACFFIALIRGVGIEAIRVEFREENSPVGYF